MSSSIDLRWKMIRISEELHEELSKIGHYGDSMGDIIKRLVDHYNKDKSKDSKK
jgi:predicted CopG family antitoxin